MYVDCSGWLRWWPIDLGSAGVSYKYNHSKNWVWHPYDFNVRYISGQGIILCPVCSIGANFSWEIKTTDPPSAFFITRIVLPRPGRASRRLFYQKQYCIPCWCKNHFLSDINRGSKNMNTILWVVKKISNIKKLRPRQNGRHYPDDMFKCIFLNDKVQIPIKISLKFVSKSSVNNIPSFVQTMVWRSPGDKPLSDPILVSLLTHICVTRPQLVNNKPTKNKQCFVFIGMHHQFFYYIKLLGLPALLQLYLYSRLTPGFNGLSKTSSR